MSDFVSVYKKTPVNHVLISLAENRKRNLNTNKIVGAVFMDLTKAFDRISHDSFLTKIKAYFLSENFLTFLYSYLIKLQKQFVNINNAHSKFQILFPNIPEVSVLEPLLVNIF